MRIIRTSTATAVSFDHAALRRSAILFVAFWLGMVAQWMMR